MKKGEEVEMKGVMKKGSEEGIGFEEGTDDEESR